MYYDIYHLIYEYDILDYKQIYYNIKAVHYASLTSERLTQPGPKCNDSLGDSLEDSLGD
jgi:hypothetical protein